MRRRRSLRHRGVVTDHVLIPNVGYKSLVNVSCKLFPLFLFTTHTNNFSLFLLVSRPEAHQGEPLRSAIPRVAVVSSALFRPQLEFTSPNPLFCAACTLGEAPHFRTFEN